MMGSILPKNTILGELEIFEVYEYLDGPRLFAVRRGNGVIYLVYWFDETETATGWLYLQVSEDRLQELKNKTLTLNNAFKEPELGYGLFSVYTSATDIATPVLLTLPPDCLPPDGYYIEHVDIVEAKDVSN